MKNFFAFIDEMKDDPCWKGYQMVGTKKKGKKEVPNCVPINSDVTEDFESSGNELYEDVGELSEEALHKGKKVKLNKPFLTPGGPKKRAVYVRNEKGNVVKVNFGDPNLEIKRDNPERRKSFRARHNCSDKTDRTSAGYWSCKFWSKTPVSKL